MTSFLYIFLNAVLGWALAHGYIFIEQARAAHSFSARHWTVLIAVIGALLAYSRFVIGGSRPDTPSADIVVGASGVAMLLSFAWRAWHGLKTRDRP